MCDPLTLIGAALTAGSTVANTMAASKVARARDDAMAAERIRQNGLDQEADALNAASQDRYQDFAGQEEQAAAKLSDYFTSQQVAEPSTEAAVPTAANNIVVREEQKQRGKARDFTNKTGAALGSLRAFGDVLGTNSRLQARDASQIGQIGGFKRGSSNVLAYELDAANQKGNGLKMFGDVLGGLGGLGVNAGLSGATPFGIGAPKVSLPTTGPVIASRPTTISNLYGGV